MNNIKISEYVSLGHPDKIADYISEYILDNFIEKDNNTKFALEVQIKDNFITLGGEISSNAIITSIDIDMFVKEALKDIGYTKEYQDKWGKDNAISCDDLVITQHISKQSLEIQQGLSGWGDQGIMWGMAVNNKETNYMPYDYYLAKKINNELFNSGLGGLDIKTQVMTDNNDEIKKIIVAIPLLDNNTKIIESFVRDNYKGNYDLVINGTGCYKKHSSIGDCGTTGRKLAVDFYGGNCNIGGGSPWTKDGTKADLTLNMYARKKALDYLKENNLNYVKCGIGCCIGQKEIDVIILNDKNEQLSYHKEHKEPQEIIDMFNLNKPIFAKLCKYGLLNNIK